MLSDITRLNVMSSDDDETTMNRIER